MSPDPTAAREAARPSAHVASTSVAVLPAGVRRLPLTTHTDERGDLTEIFRSQWPTGVAPVQWNLVHSNANTLRGVHVHIRHWDYLVFLSGCTDVALIDLRDGSPTEGLATFARMPGDGLSALIIPPGVAHAFVTIEAATLVYAVTDYWAGDDELPVLWSDPALGLDWPLSDPIVSKRDAAAPPLSVLRDQLAPHQPFSGTY